MLPPTQLIHNTSHFHNTKHKLQHWSTKLQAKQKPKKWTNVYFEYQMIRRQIQMLPLAWSTQNNFCFDNTSTKLEHWPITKLQAKHTKQTSLALQLASNQSHHTKTLSKQKAPSLNKATSILTCLWCVNKSNIQTTSNI